MILNCCIKGCEASASTYLGEPFEVARWFVARVCQCGALTDKSMACICSAPPGYPVHISYWPNLDWWLYGGVDEIVLCPDHRVLVTKEIVRQQGLDPSMDSERPNPTNRH